MKVAFIPNFSNFPYSRSSRLDCSTLTVAGLPRGRSLQAAKKKSKLVFINERTFIYICPMRTRDGNKESAIRERALEMVVRDGFDGLSMQKLAKAASVSPATIYIYFKDRDDLMHQLWLQEMKKMVDATLQGFDPAMRFDEGMKIQWLNRARFCMQNPTSMHFLEQIKYSPYYEAFMKKIDNTFINTMSKFVHNAINRKEVVKLPLEVYWSVAFAPLYQLVKMHMTGKGLRGGPEKFVLDDKTINQTLKLVLKALKP